MSSFLLRSRQKEIFYRSLKKNYTFDPGEMAERSNAAVLKTVEGNTSGGSNPSLSAGFNHKLLNTNSLWFFILQFSPLLVQNNLRPISFFSRLCTIEGSYPRAKDL